MTLSEIVLALALTVTVVGMTLSVIEPAHRALSVQAQTDDMFQRARVGFVALHRVLLDAATPAAAGGGPLRPAVVPFVRAGADHAGADAISMITLSTTDARAVTDAPIEGGTGTVHIRATPGCERFRAACGLRVGSTALIFDERGRSDLVRITDVLGDVISVVSMESVRLPVYPVGSTTISVDVHRYYFDRNRGQVRHYDGWKTDVPVLDNVVALSVQYFGSPLRPVGESEEARPSCPDGSRSFSRRLRPEVELSLSVLTDGPWCGSHPRFDVDLFGVRRVRIVLRLQASAAEHRGSDRRVFARPGPAVDHKRLVPDATVRFDVVLRSQ